MAYQIMIGSKFWCPDKHCVFDYQEMAGFFDDPRDAVDHISSAEFSATGGRLVPYTPCSTCEGQGWVQVWSLKPPAFGVCPDCNNPRDLPSP